MNDEPLEEWIERAEEDFRQAQVALRQRKYPAYNTVCFHSQQSAEKYVKAFLVRHRIHIRKIHDLLRLKILCMEADPTFDLISESLALLFPYAVDARYPGFRATEQDARAAVAAMKSAHSSARGSV